MNGHAVLLLLAFGLPATGQAETRIDRFAGDEFQVNTHELNDQRIPAVAVDADGNSLVVWQSQGLPEDGWDVFARRLDANGAAQAPELQVNEFTSGRQEGQHVTALPTADFVVAWNGASRRGVTQGIHARHLDNNGMPLGSDRPVGGLSEELQLLPRVAAGAAGGYLVVWEGRALYDDTFSIPGQFMTDDGTPDGPLIRISQQDETQQRRVDLARSPDGGYMVVWQSSGQDGDSWGVFGRCLADDGSGNGEFRINQSSKGAQSRPRVAALGQHGFAVVWHDNRGRSTFEYRRVMLRHFDPQCQPLGDERQVNQFDQGIQDLPDIAAAADGSHLVVWHSLPEDFEDQGIYARRIDRNRNFHGDEIRIHQEREAFQDFPAVDTLPGGGFFAVWESVGQDESGFGIFGRRFAGPTATTLQTDSGDRQTTPVESAFAAPLAVRVRDQWGVGMPGRTVRFTSTQTGPGAVFGNGETTQTVTTGPGGLAVVTARANSAAGSHGVGVRLVDGGVTTSFKLENLGGPLPTVRAIPVGSWPGWLLLAGCLVASARTRRS